MNTVSICSNTKADVIRALSEGGPLTTLDIHDHITDHHYTCQATIYNAIRGLVALALITPQGQRSVTESEAYTLSAHGDLVADALEVYDTICELRRRSAEPGFYPRTILRADHKAKRLSFKLKKRPAAQSVQELRLALQLLGEAVTQQRQDTLLKRAEQRSKRLVESLAKASP